MAKTANPNKYLDKFQDQVASAADRYRRLEHSLEASAESDETKKGVAEDSAFRLGVLWETFQGDWFLASISRDPAAFVGRMQGELNAAVDSSWARGVIEMMNPGALTLSPRPTLRQIEKMLDPQGFNITFVDSKAWKKSAEKHLQGDYVTAVRRVADNVEAASFLHLVKKLRNHLAHSSTGSKEEFNKAAKARAANGRVGLTGAANDPLKREDRGVSDLGKYLRVKPRQNGPRRVEIIHERLSEVSELMRV